MIQAEVRRLAAPLRPSKVLHRDALEQVAGADRWHEGGFEDAIEAAVRAGRLKRLGARFYRDANRAAPPGLDGADTSDG